MAQIEGQQPERSQPLWRRAGFLPFIGVAFLNALLDLGHKILVQNTLFKSYDGPEQVLLTAIVNALILLPFILLFTPAGFLSDRFAKPAVMRVAALAALLLTLLITWFYYQGWFWGAFALTFLLAAQSALYSPAKYGYIKELVGSDNLSVANGWMQAATIIAILSGIVLFSLLFEWRLSLVATPVLAPEPLLRQFAPLGWLLVLLAALESVLAFRLGEGRPQPALRLDRRAYLRGTLLRQNLARVTGHAPILWSVIGLALFWSISQVMVAVYPAYVKQHLGELNTFLIQGAMALSGIGILLGSMLAARLSAHQINTGLIPAGALLIALGLLLLPFSGDLLQAGLLFFAVGVGGALCVVPLNALIQFHAPEESSGAVLAGNNFIQNLAMVAALLATVVSAWFELPARLLLLALAVAAALGAVLALFYLPQALLRLLLRLLLHGRYRLQLMGLEHLPADGRGTLLLGNHISWLDWAMLLIASPRHVHFVMERSIYRRWYLKWLLDLYGVVPIASGHHREAIAGIGALLREGRVVCLFPEGAISYSGQLGEFKRGFERLARLDGLERVAIVPFYLRGLWGSRFSRAALYGPVVRRAGWKRDVILAFGKPLPLQSGAGRVKQAVAELSIRAWQRYTDRLDTLPRAFIRSARSAPSAWALTELSGPPLSHARLLARSLILRRQLKSLRGERVGVLLPASAPGMLGYLALLMNGCTLVPIDPALPPAALMSAWRRSGARVLLTSAGFRRQLARERDLSLLYQDAELLELESLPACSDAELWRLRWSLGILPGWLLARWFGGPARPDDTAVILLTPGRADSARAIQLSHRNLMANLKQMADLFNLRSDDRVAAALPLCQGFGLTASLMPLIEGAPLVCVPEPDDALLLGRAVARHRVTLLCSSGGLLQRYADSTRLVAPMFDSVRLLVSGGGRLDAQVRERFERRFRKPVYDSYGCSETTPLASVNLPDHLDTVYWSLQVGHKPGSVGMALPGSCFRIVDPQTFAPLAAGQVGRILIGGTQRMQGYLDDPELSAARLVEQAGLHWYVSDDLGVLDADGFLSLCERLPADET